MPAADSQKAKPTPYSFCSPAAPVRPYFIALRTHCQSLLRRFPWQAAGSTRRRLAMASARNQRQNNPKVLIRVPFRPQLTECQQLGQAVRLEHPFEAQMPGKLIATGMIIKGHFTFKSMNDLLCE